MLDYIILQAQAVEQVADINDVIKWVISGLTVIGLWVVTLRYLLSNPIKKSEEKTFEKMNELLKDKADQPDLDRLRVEVDCLKNEIKEEIHASEARTVMHIGNRIGDLHKLVSEHLNKGG
jgi:hypothetical protein